MNQSPLVNFISIIAKKYYYFIIFILFYILAKGFFVLLPSYFIKMIVDSLIRSNEYSGYQLFFSIIGYFFIQNLIIGLQYLYKNFVLYRFTALVRKYIIDIAVENLLYKKNEFFYNKNNSELVHFIFHLHEYCIDFLTLMCESIAPKVVTLLISIILFFIFDIVSGLIILAWIIVLVICVYYALDKFATISIEVLQSKIGVTKNTIDLLNNILSVQFFCTEQKELTCIKNQTTSLVDDECYHRKFFIILDMIYSYSFLAVQLISLAILYVKYCFGYISISSIISWWSMIGILGMLGENSIVEVLTAAKLFFGMYEAGQMLDWYQTPMLMHKKDFVFEKGHIVFESVSLKLQEVTVIKDFSFDFPVNKKIAIVGFSGSGKTSLINLILGIYQPTQGIVSIDGQEIQNINLTTLYNHIAVVFQNNVLFDRSIEENIFYGFSLADKQKYVDIMNLLNIEDIVERQNHCNESIHLSGGQKQKIHIARAFCQKEKEILILDEPTSNIDPAGEAAVMAYINAIANNKTIFMITHKLSIINSFDLILVFDRGRMIEYGTHMTLMANNGLYKKLYTLDTLV